MRQMHKYLRETHMIGDHTREWMVGANACPALAELQIELAGVSDAAYGFRFVRRNWEYAQVLACHFGHGQVLVDDRWQTCSEGTAYITPAGMLHAYHAVRESRWGVCWAHIRVTAGQPPIVTAPRPTLVRVNPRPLRAAIMGLFRESSGECEPAPMKAWASLVHHYLHRMSRPLHREDRLWQLWESVSSDLARPWSIRDLADLAGISGEHLRRLCRRQLRCSPMQHVTHLRMRQAAGMLASTDRKIEVIARAVGYDSPFAFSAAFKRHMGHCPADYRRRNLMTP